MGDRILTFAADSRLFTDYHGLQHYHIILGSAQRTLQVALHTERIFVHGQVAGKILQVFVLQRLFSEHRVELTKSMSNLIDALFLRENQLLRVFRIQRGRFKEGAYARRRVQKILITWRQVSSRFESTIEITYRRGVLAQQ